MTLKSFLVKSLISIVFLIVITLLFLIQPIQRFSNTDGLVPSQHSATSTVIISIWNLHNQQSIFGNDNLTTIKDQFVKTSLKDSDLIALQEVTDNEKINEITEPYGFIFSGQRDAILSKHAIVKSGHIIINPYGRTAFWSDIQITNDTVLRLYSVHLSFKQDRSPFIEKQRGEEMANLLKHAADFNGPTIIAGDFNTITVFKSEIKKIPALYNLNEAGYKSSRPIDACDSHIPLGQQDWIFVKGAEVIRYVCGNYAGSDHRWIQAEIGLK